jgi:hypothetical protein
MIDARFRLARAMSVVVFVSAAFLLLFLMTVIAYFFGAGTPVWGLIFNRITVIGAFITFTLSSVGTASTVFFWWRQERCESEKAQRESQEI